MGSLSSRWLTVAGVVLLVAIAYASLLPVAWQFRTGLHWLIEHFVIFFVVTTVFCIAFQRPMLVAAILLPLGVVLEMLQGLTPERVPDLPTALSAAAGVAAAALLADLAITLRKRRKDAATGPSP
jgi:hypothetical protein